MIGLSLIVIFVANLSKFSIEASAEQVLTFEDPKIVCGENQVVSPCYNDYCVRRYCDEEAPSKDCKLQEPCVMGCACKEGYLRAENDTCVPDSVCTNPIKCGENEVFTHCVNGGCDQTTCSEVGRAALCRDLIAGACKSGCNCKQDYRRTASGTCVPIHECPKNEVCSKPHEYLDLCPSRCPLRDCSFNNDSSSCPPQPKPGDADCYPSCECEEGYYKNFNQDCVAYEYCNKYCTGYNEILVAYPESCEEETCDSINNGDTLVQNSKETCFSECRCFPNYVRNKRGDCIKKEDCGKCQGPNEYLDCSTPCDNVCATLDKMNRTNCPFKQDWGRCVDMCYCEDGYARDSNNICIPIADCPKAEENAE